MKDSLTRLSFECRNCKIVLSRKAILWHDGKCLQFPTIGNCSGEEIVRQGLCEKCNEDRACLRCGEPVRAAMLCMDCAIRWAEIYPKYENYMYAYGSWFEGEAEEDREFPKGCLVVFDGVKRK